MSKLFAVLLAVPALLLAACSSENARDTQPQVPLAGARIGGPFTLTGSKGQDVSWSDFDGRYRIVYFGYTFCPDVCPLDVQTMMQGLAVFARKQPALAHDIQPIFISIDPERDTPERLGEFEGAFPGLEALTGSEDAIAATVKSFAGYRKRGEDLPGGGYLMDHSRAAYLMGRSGEPIALLPVDTNAAQVADTLERWVR